MSSEILNSAKDHLRRRLNTPIYGSFLIFWLIFHWEFIVTLFFVSEENIFISTGLLKNEYLKISFFDFFNPSFYFLWLLPVILTLLVIWKLPKWVLIPAFEQEEKYRTEKAKIRIKQEQIIQAEESILEAQKAKKAETIEKRTKSEKEAKTIDPSIEWLKELDDIRVNYNNLNSLKEVVKVIYGARGRYTTRPEGSSTSVPYLSAESLARIDALELIDITREQNLDYIHLNEKGKFMVRKLQEKHLM